MTTETTMGMTTETVFEIALKEARENNVRLNVRFDPYTGTVDFGFSYGSFTRSVYFREVELEKKDPQGIEEAFKRTIRRAKRAYDEYVAPITTEDTEKQRDVRIGMILQSTEEGAKK